MPEESTTATNGADTTTEKAGAPKKKTAAASKPKPKVKTPKKKAAKKKAARAKKKGAGVAAKKKTTQKATPPDGKEEDEKRRGVPPDKSIRFLLLKKAHPDKSDAAICRMVICSPNQVGKVRENQKLYEQMIAEMSEEEKERRLATVLEKKARGKKPTSQAKVKSAVAKNEQRSEADLVSMVNSFRRAVRFLGTHHARMLLEEFDQ